MCAWRRIFVSFFVPIFRYILHRLMWAADEARTMLWNNVVQASNAILYAGMHKRNQTQFVIICNSVAAANTQWTNLTKWNRITFTREADIKGIAIRMATCIWFHRIEATHAFGEPMNFSSNAPSQQVSQIIPETIYAFLYIHNWIKWTSFRNP